MQACRSDDCIERRADGSSGVKNIIDQDDCFSRNIDVWQLFGQWLFKSSRKGRTFSGSKGVDAFDRLDIGDDPLAQDDSPGLDPEDDDI